VKPKLTDPNDVKRMEPKIITDRNFREVLRKYPVNQLDREWKEMIFAHAILALPAALKSLEGLSYFSQHPLLIAGVKGARKVLEWAYKKAGVKPYNIKL